MRITEPKILFLVSEDWYFWSHRLPVARAARDAGFRVVVATCVNRHGDMIRKEGFKLIPIRLRRTSQNPFHDLQFILDLVRIYRRERPNVVHHVALKPVLYGLWASKITGVPGTVNAMAGLGSVFVSRSLKAAMLRNVIRMLYRVVHGSKNTRMIFQNPDDIVTFWGAGGAERRDVVLIKGSGVDMSVYSPLPEPEETPLVVFASRMLWDKGVGEYVKAAQRIHDAGIRARFALVGESDSQNPTEVPPAQLEAWQNSGVVEWWGRCDDMPAVFARSHIVCLPSAYGEGIPKVLIEAAACGRAVVTTDAPGCREIVRHLDNGLLVPVGNVSKLADALRQLITDPEMRKRMGGRGREIAVAEFSEERVVRQTLAVYRELLH